MYNEIISTFSYKSKRKDKEFQATFLPLFFFILALLKLSKNYVSKMP